jgi:hypothetical protein
VRKDLEEIQVLKVLKVTLDPKVHKVLQEEMELLVKAVGELVQLGLKDL